MSEPLYAPRLRPERLIATSRVVLAFFSLLAVWLDSDEPVRYTQLAYAVLVAYVAYAAVVAAILWQAAAVSRLWPVLTHAADLACFALLIFCTEGPASPFTMNFVFALIAATLRWQVRGTLWTALVVFAAFIGSAAYFGLVLQDPNFDLRALIIRGVDLMVLAGLLGYVGTQDQRTLREMWQLASWPQTVSPDAESLAKGLLEYAASLLETPRVVLAWAEPESPWRRIAIWDRGAWVQERQPVDDSLVDDTLRDRTFSWTGTPVRRVLVKESQGIHLTAWEGEPISQAFARHLAIGTALSVPLSGESFEGRLFFLDKPDTTLDDLVLAEIAAGVITARLDAFSLTQQLRQAAATEERIRLARDLHDGVLQSFTGIALRLAAARRMMEKDRQGALGALEDVQRVLASEQRDVRFFIQELKPTPPPAERAALEVRLKELAQRMEREWDLHVDLHLDTAGAQPLSPAVGRDVYHIVREALVNAARHGAASIARVAVAPIGDDGIRVTIADNGCGFSFSGRYSVDDLARLDLGPKTLRERVVAMQGSLTLASAPTGAEVDIVLPLSAAA